MPLFLKNTIPVATSLETLELGIWQITGDELHQASANAITIPKYIRHPQKKLQYVASRMLIKHHLPAIDIKNDIKQESNYKPYLVNYDMRFSLSHTHNWVAFLLSRHFEVGVDIEVISDKTMRVYNKFISNKEREILQGLSNEFTSKEATLAWSIKETVYKWYGKRGVNFIRMIEINKVKLLDNTNGIAQVWFKKHKLMYPLDVYFTFFFDTCIAYTYTPIDMLL